MSASEPENLAPDALQFPADLREKLGLRDGESLRLLDRGPRTLLLERCGGDGATALPWHNELVLVADVASLPMATVLGLLHSRGKSGFLFFTHDEHAKAVYLHRGEVVFASSNQRVDRLGECLLRAGVISLAQLREAERRFRPPGRFGKVLVELGCLTPRDLWNGVRYQVEEIVRSLFSYTAGKLYFWEGEVQPDNVVRLSLPTARLVREGLRRRDELLRLLALLEHPRVRLEPVPGRRADLSSTELALLEAIESEASFTAARRRVGLDALTAARTVQLLRLAGALRLRREERNEGFLGEGDLQHHEEEFLRQLALGYVKLVAELAAPLVAVEGEARLRERLETVLCDAAHRHPALLEGMELGRGLALDPERIVERALALPARRAEALRAALEELVTYLEFELRNHPRIEEPETFLDAVEPLRARLEG